MLLIKLYSIKIANIIWLLIITCGNMAISIFINEDSPKSAYTLAKRKEKNGMWVNMFRMTLIIG